MAAIPTMSRGFFLFGLALQHGKLLTEGEVLHDKVTSGPKASEACAAHEGG